VAGADVPVEGRAVRGKDEVVWFHITAGQLPADDIQGALTAVVDEVSERLAAWNLGLERDMLLDLLSPDPQPKVDTYGDERTGIRHVSTMAVVARELPDTEDDLDGVDEQLTFQLVENLIGDGWIVSCWHPARLLSGATADRSGVALGSVPTLSLLQEPFVQQVRRHWVVSEHMSTSGDLGMVFARELADAYAASQRMIERWVQRTEVQFFDGLSEEADVADGAAPEIPHMLAMVGEFRRCLTAFEHARTSTADRSWFPRLSGDGEGDANAAVKALLGIIEGAQKKLDVVFGAIRADVDLLMLQGMGRQQRANESQEQARLDLQDKITRVTVLFLVPTLIAGIFGANTQLPGGGRWFGFDLMLILMVLSSLGIYLLIKTTRRPRRKAGEWRRHRLSVDRSTAD
jgi:hypothetical protein